MPQKLYITEKKQTSVVDGLMPVILTLTDHIEMKNTISRGLPREEKRDMLLEDAWSQMAQYKLVAMLDTKSDTVDC